MDILILGALEEEIAGVRAAMQDINEKKVGIFTVYDGNLYGHRLLLCKCGVGKSTAAAATAVLLTAYPSVRRVINTGVAGGIDGTLRRGDIALGERTVHHDYDATADGYRKGQVEGFDSEFFDGDAAMLAELERALGEEHLAFRKGVIASGDQFIADDDTARRIHEEFGAIACDFESAPIAQICALYGVPFVSMRAISDNGGDNAVSSFYEFLHAAAANNVRAICRFMKNLA